MSKTIQFIHFSDTHGHLKSNDLSHLHQVSGLSRLSTYCRSLNESNTLIIDTGDSIQGGPYAYYYMKHKDEFDHPIASIMNHIGVDYFIPGNHDFNYGLPFLKNYLKRLEATSLCANIKNNYTYYFDAPYAIKMIDGIKICVLGLTNDFIQIWESKKTLEELTFTDSFQTIKTLLHDIKTQESPDLIVLGYHGGVESDLKSGIPFKELLTSENIGYRLYQMFPEIHLLLTSHEHRTFIYQQGHRVVTQTGANAQSCASITVTFNDDKQLTSMDATMIALKDFEEDISVLAKHQAFFDACDQYLHAPLTTLNVSAKVANPFDLRATYHPLAHLSNSIQKDILKTDLSVCSFPNVVDGFHHVVTVKELLQAYPFYNTLIKARITGKTLRNAIEENAFFFTLQDNNIVIRDTFIKPKLELYNYDLFSDITYTLTVSNDKTHVSALKKNGIPIKDSDTFTIAINSYRFQGGGGFQWVKSLDFIEEYPIEYSEMMLQYFESHQPLTFHPPKESYQVIKK